MQYVSELASGGGGSALPTELQMDTSEARARLEAVNAVIDLCLRGGHVAACESMVEVIGDLKPEKAGLKPIIGDPKTPKPL